MVKHPYHTALSRGELSDGPETQSWRSDQGDVAMVWPIEKGEPPAPRSDLIYAEIPWLPGYKIFNKRAGIDQAPSFEAMARAADLVARTVCERGGAAILVASDALWGRVLKPDLMFWTNLNGDRVRLGVYGRPLIPIADNMTVEHLITALAAVHDRVWDPCCGYGRTGRIFTAAGKAWTLTDINPKCIGRIALDAPGWGRHEALPEGQRL